MEEHSILGLVPRLWKQASNYASKQFFNGIVFLSSLVACLVTYLVACLPSFEDWKNYRTKKAYENISEEKVKEKLENKKYCEVLLDTYYNQPARTAETADNLKMDRETVRNIQEWFVKAGVMKKFKITDDDELVEKAREKIASVIREKGIRGAALKRLKSSYFYRVTLRGESFLEIACKNLGLNMEKKKI
jgi:hypothetical protein